MLAPTPVIIALVLSKADAGGLSQVSGQPELHSQAFSRKKNPNNIRKYKGKDGREQLHFTKNLEEAHGLFTVDTTIHHTGYLH